LRPLGGLLHQPLEDPRVAGFPGVLQADGGGCVHPSIVGGALLAFARSAAILTGWTCPTTTCRPRPIRCRRSAAPTAVACGARCGRAPASWRCCSWCFPRRTP